MVKLNERMEAGTDAAIPTVAQVNHVSQTIANALLPAVFRQHLDELRKVALSPRYEKNRQDAFIELLNRVSRWLDVEEGLSGRHFVIFDGLVFMLPTHIYKNLMEYYVAFSQAIRNGENDLDGYDECNNLFNYKEWIKRHYAPISQPSDNLDKGQLNPVELDNLPF